MPEPSSLEEIWNVTGFHCEVPRCVVRRISDDGTVRYFSIIYMDWMGPDYKTPWELHGEDGEVQFDSWESAIEYVNQRWGERRK